MDNPTSSEEAEKINPLHDVTEVKETISSVEGSSNSSSEKSVSEISEQELVLVPPSEVTEQPADLQQPAEKSHVVKNGETLFSISMDYYGNRNGETIIMKANNKKVNTVYVGEVLRIPSY